MYQALLFDMDHTLANTQGPWRAAVTATLELMGIKYSPEYARYWTGMKATDLAAKAHEIFQPGIAVEECQEFMRQRLLEEYEKQPVYEIPGAISLVRRLSGRVPMAVASGSPQSGIESTIAHLGIADCFDLLISSEPLENGKPAPDVFLETARLLHIDPAECLVFEDSLVGVQAAAAADMNCIVRPEFNLEELRRLPCRIVEHWDEVTPEGVFTTP